MNMKRNASFIMSNFVQYLRVSRGQNFWEVEVALSLVFSTFDFLASRLQCYHGSDRWYNRNLRINKFRHQYFKNRVSSNRKNAHHLTCASIRLVKLSLTRSHSLILKSYTSILDVWPPTYLGFNILKSQSWLQHLRNPYPYKAFRPRRSRTCRTLQKGRKRATCSA